MAGGRGGCGGVDKPKSSREKWQLAVPEAFDTLEKAIWSLADAPDELPESQRVRPLPAWTIWMGPRTRNEDWDEDWG